MSHFYGTLIGQAGEVTRRGSKNSGLRIAAASWSGAVYVRLWHQDGKDHYAVELGPWKGNGRGTEIIASGDID